MYLSNASWLEQKKRFLEGIKAIFQLKVLFILFDHEELLPPLAITSFHTHKSYLLLVCCRYYSLIDEKHILGNINIFSLRPKHTAIPHPLPAHATFTDPDFIKFIFCLDVTTIINSLTSWCRWVFRRINVPSVHKNIWS